MDTEYVTTFETPQKWQICRELSREFLTGNWKYWSNLCALTVSLRTRARAFSRAGVRRYMNNYFRGSSTEKGAMENHQVLNFKCVFAALVIQHTICMSLSSEASLALPLFPTLSHKRHDLRKARPEQLIVFLIFSTTFVWNISHSKKDSERDSYTSTCLQVK
jgi:hypothetical protein